MEHLKGSIEVIQIQIGQKLTPVVQALALWLADKLPAAFDAVSEAGGRLTDFFKDFVGDIQWAIENGTGFEEKLVPQFGAVTEAIAHVAIFIRDDLLPAFDAIRDRVQPAADAIGAFISSEKESLLKAFALVVGVGLVVAFGALAIAAGSAALGVIAATAPIIAIGVVVGALAFGIVKLVEHWDEITERMPIVGAAMDAVGGVIASIPPLLDMVAAAWRENVMPVLEEGVEKFQNDVFPTLERFGDMLEMIGELIVDWVEISWNFLLRTLEVGLGIIQSVWDEILAIFTTSFGIIAQVVETGMELLRDTISVIMALVRGDWEEAWEGIKTLLSNIWENIGELVSAALDGVQAVISLGWETVKAVTLELWDLIHDIISGVWDKIGDTIAGALEAIGGTMSSAWDGIKSTVSNASEFITGILGGLADIGRSAFGGMKDAALDELDNLRLGLLSTGQEIINTLGDVFGRAKDWVGQQFSGILGVIKGPINDAIGAINSLIYAWNGLNFTVGGGSFLGKQLPSLSMGTPDLPAIPYLAAGGIVTRPTLAMIGEAGPEAVIPLGKGMGGGNTYNITVNALDARSAADAVLQALVQLERRGGITGGVTRTLA
jgi:phage-related protein